MTDYMNHPNMGLSDKAEVETEYAFYLDGVSMEDGFESHLEAYKAMFKWVAQASDFQLKGWYEATVRSSNGGDWDIEYLIENSREI